MALGDRLRAARERSGLTLMQVQEKTGVGVSSLSEFETGMREPKVSHLQKLARLYHRSIDFLLGEEEMPQELVLWRQRPASPLAEQAESQFLELCNWYHNLEVWCDERKTHCLPDAMRPKGRFWYTDAQRLAHEVRRKLELGDHPAMSLLKVLEEVCGVKVFHLPLEPSGTAACSRSVDFGAAILLNSNNVRWRRNFDLAHELFHLLTWPIFRTEQSQEPDQIEEKLATCFARHLLMPEEPFRDAMNECLDGEKIEPEDLVEIARLFDVSADAVAWHAAFLFNIKKEEDVHRLIAGAKAVPDVRESDRPGQRPERFRALAAKALNAGEISIGRFAEYVGVSRGQAMRYTEQGKAEYETVAAAPA